MGVLIRDDAMRRTHGVNDTISLQQKTHVGEKRSMNRNLTGTKRNEEQRKSLRRRFDSNVSTLEYLYREGIG